MTDLTHLDDHGRARMVDVGGKPATERVAVAGAEVVMPAAVLAAVERGDAPKGDVLGTARLAGIMAAKRTGDLIPLCHPLPLDQVAVDFAADPALPGIRIEATARITAKTGVEMEALTAATVAALTLYDMVKGLDKGVEIARVRLLHKTGGKSGIWHAEDYAGPGS